MEASLFQVLIFVESSNKPEKPKNKTRNNPKNRKEREKKTKAATEKKGEEKNERKRPKKQKRENPKPNCHNTKLISSPGPRWLRQAKASCDLLVDDGRSAPEVFGAEGNADGPGPSTFWGSPPVDCRLWEGCRVKAKLRLCQAKSKTIKYVCFSPPRSRSLGRLGVCNFSN